MELREYLRLFRRRWWLIASIAFLGATFAWLTAPAEQAPRVQRFRAEHQLIVEPLVRQWTPENPETIALLATSGFVPDRAAARIGGQLSDVDALLQRVEVTGDGELGVITIAATTNDASRSSEIADVFAEELVAFLDEQERAARSRQEEDLRTEIEDLRLEISQLTDQIAAGDGDAVLLEEQRLVLVARYGGVQSSYQTLLADPPATSGLRSLGAARASEVDAGIHAPRGRTERSAILGLIGLLIGLAAVIALDRLDVRIKTKEDAEAAYRMPVIAEIPAIPLARRRRHEVISHVEPTSSVAEAYRGLRTTLMIIKPTTMAAAAPGLDTMRRRASDIAPVTEPTPTFEPPSVFIVTSTRPSEGKTSTSMNLAAVFAEAGRSVIVVGADIRRPEAHVYAGVARAPGLTEALRGAVRHLPDVIVPTQIPGVRIVPSGSHVSNPAEILLQGPDLIRELRSMADIVIVDSTPLLTVNDAIQLIPAADAVVVTCRAGRGTAEAAKRAQEILARLRAPVAGIVLVGARQTPGVSTYYYGYQASTTANPLDRLRRSVRRSLRRDHDDLNPVPDHPPAPSIEPAGAAPQPDRRALMPPPPSPSPPPVDRRVADEPAPALCDTEATGAAPARRGNGREPSTTDETEANPWSWP